MNLISFKLQVGQWFTPSACVQLFSRAVSQSISPLLSSFRIHLCSDGRLSVPQLDRLSGNWTRQIILFVSLRLGTSIVNEVERNYEISTIYPFNFRFTILTYGISCLSPIVWVLAVERKITHSISSDIICRLIEMIYF